MKRRNVIASILAVIVLLVVVVFVYTFTNVGKSGSTCPPLLLGSGYAAEGPMPFKIEAVGNQTGVITGTAQIRGPSGSGTIMWCIYNGSGTLVRSLQTDRIISDVVASANGQLVAVSGFQIAPGPAGAYNDGALYLFDKSGMAKWSLTTAQPILATDISSNGSAIIAFGSELLYLNSQGQVIWNYTSGAFTAALVGDGSSVAAGVGENSVGTLVMLDSRGNMLWNRSIPNGGFGSTDIVSVSNGLIAAGVANSGLNGTLLCYDFHGGLVWSHHIDSDILSVNFQNNGSTILIETNWGHVTFDRSGNVIDNQTVTH